MATFLDSLRDDHGLVPLIHVRTNPASPRELYLAQTGQQIYVSPEAFGVSDYIVTQPHFAEVARLMLLESPRGLKAASVWGLSFDLALSLAAKATPGFIHSSLFKALEGDEAVDYARCTSLLAHVRKTSQHVQLEVWQRLDSRSETYYVHGLLSPDLSYFTHFDGATMYFTDDEADQIIRPGNQARRDGVSEILPTRRKAQYRRN